MTSESQTDNLTPKQRLFVQHYMACFNGTQAAILAGYSEKTARFIASENLTKPNIRAAIKEATREIMPAAEVVQRLADQARGSLQFFMRRDGDNELTGFDLGEDKPLHLIRKLKMTRRREKGRDKDDDAVIETIDIEIYDAHAALVDIGKMHGLFVDRTEMHHTGLTPDKAATLSDEELDEQLRKRGLL